MGPRPFSGEDRWGDIEDVILNVVKDPAAPWDPSPPAQDDILRMSPPLPLLTKEGNFPFRSQVSSLVVHIA